MATTPSQPPNMTHSLPNLGQFQIPRPKCLGMEFVTMRGSRSGFYRTINKSVALKYGMVQQRNSTASQRRPTIPEGWWPAELGRGGKKGPGASSIPEEPEAEPMPDYEVPTGEEEQKNGNHSGGGKSEMAESSQEEKKVDRIAVPNGLAPPAPPLPLDLCRALLRSKQHKTMQNDRMEKKVTSKSSPRFGLLMARGHKCGPTAAEEREESGGGGLVSIRL